MAMGKELTPGCTSASRMDSSKLIFCSLTSVMRALPRHSSEETKSARVATAGIQREFPRSRAGK